MHGVVLNISTVKSMKMEVQIISSENVKPSSPTPPHLRNFTLSFLDQKYSPLLNSTLLFYGAPNGAVAPPLDITRLKTCLSQTLTTFYPLAGRYKTWGTIICNDEGIPFVEAEVNCPLSSVVGSISSSSLSNIDLSSLYPPKENLISSGIHLAIQVIKFSCGGFAVGWYHTHKITDGVSTATFFRHWSALVAERYEDAAQALPDFNAAVIAFPPVPEDEEVKAVTPELKHEEEKTEEDVNWDFMFKKRVLVRSFVLNNKAVTEIKAKSVSDEVPNPSRFMSIAGFLWKHIASASSKEGRTMLSVVVDARSRSDPSLPEGAMGNILELALVQAEKQTQLPELVGEIHGSISKMKDLVPEYQGVNRVVAKERYRRDFINTLMEYKGKDAYLFSSWCKSSGYRDVDFGFGKPQWIVPLYDTMNQDNHRNLIILTEYADSEGDGFEAWLFLEEEHIKYLETCPQFLAFASPNFQLNNWITSSL